MAFMHKVYEHTHSHRFLLKQEDKQVLSRIFSEMGLAKTYKKHLDLFNDVKGKEVQKQALATFALNPPENIMMDFDFENRVVIMKNKKTQQMMILFGSEHQCEQSISFGKQLIDTFKPKTLFVEAEPLEESSEESRYDEVQGTTFPGASKIIDSVKGLELNAFIQASIIQNTDAYQVDMK